ncbi:GDSL esterase/lipase [Hibiscus syriacus]|uniref:GDSL esterase/lipase n=1 Tax=Hibiscus syriacus TaxID=106335 RepID=A0A6A3CGQ7_HIBSY|nr:GDSL esterase/lipase [Hibiscus syriacus]
MASSVVVSWIVLGLFMAISTTHVEAVARAFFEFGDYLVDNGNNDYLDTTARADSPPYGIDTPSHRPTGRFSNGKNIPDFIKPTLQYLSPELNGDKLLVGANFATASIGILNDTGIQFFKSTNFFFHNPFKSILPNSFSEKYQSRLADLVGEDEAQRIVNDALVLITVGGNDFVNNYYLVPFSARSRQFNLPDYVRYLISEYNKLLMRLYELGARRVLVTGTGPLGCVPTELAMRTKWLNSQPGTTIFLAANTQQQTINFISNPGAYGFTTSKIACCGQGLYNGLGLCTPLSNLCPNRDEYVFWDPFQPSERANRILVDMILKGSAEHMCPMILSTFLALDTITKT